MRPDQITRLNELSENLTDVLFEEADPEQWPGAGVPLADLSKQDRGDRYWCKKNAVATLTLIGRVVNLTQTLGTNQGTDNDTELDAEINAAEKEASRLLNELQRRQKKAEFDSRVHGKS